MLAVLHGSKNSRKASILAQVRRGAARGAPPADVDRVRVAGAGAALARLWINWKRKGASGQFFQTVTDLSGKFVNLPNLIKCFTQPSVERYVSRADIQLKPGQILLDETLYWPVILCEKFNANFLIRADLTSFPRKHSIERVYFLLISS